MLDGLRGCLGMSFFFCRAKVRNNSHRENGKRGIFLNTDGTDGTDGRIAGDSEWWGSLCEKSIKNLIQNLRDLKVQK